jgi:hypothetical protein
VSRLLAVVLAAATLAPGAALAATESPRRGSFEFRVQPYRPNIDDEFDGAARPYFDIFGDGREYILRGDVSWTFFERDRYGTFDLGIGVGFVQSKGYALLPGTLQTSGDKTRLRIIPTAITLTYRYDGLARRYRWLPIAPYGRASLERWNWWVTAGSGGATDANGRHSTGATNGYGLTGGIALLLDSIDPARARDMDNNLGINDVYAYAEITRSRIDDFGSSSSWDLSPDNGSMWGFGLLFVF